MKCPFCKDNELKSAKKPGYYVCSGCCFSYLEKVNEDPELSLYRYDFNMFRSKEVDPEIVFEIAKRKFGDEKYELVGVKPEIGDYSFLFGQRYYVLLRKHK